MRRGVFLILFAALMLAGCGGGGAPSTAPAQSATDTPEAVHAGWVAAMQENNRDALLALAADMEFKAAFVNDNLGPFQSNLQPNGCHGPIRNVELLPLTDDGQGKIGVSVWTFEKRSACYNTKLTASGGVWKVTSWGVMARCPEKN
jgi:hypothetical protein